MSERHFRVCKLEGKNIELGGVSISSKASPGSAARKLLTSIAHHKGLKKNKKTSLPKVKYCIQEYTQGSSKKIYGPYVGHFHKYTAAELKKAETAGGKVKFTMKPVVKLAKGKNNMKGGLVNNKSEVYKLVENIFEQPGQPGQIFQKNEALIIGFNKNTKQYLVIKQIKDNLHYLVDFLNQCWLSRTGYCIGRSSFEMKIGKDTHHVCYKKSDIEDNKKEIFSFISLKSRNDKEFGTIIKNNNNNLTQVRNNSSSTQPKNNSLVQVSLDNNNNKILKDFDVNYLLATFVNDQELRNINIVKNKLRDETITDEKYYIIRKGKELFGIPKDLSKFPKNFLFKNIVLINTEKLKNGIIELDCKQDQFFKQKITKVCTKLGNEFSGCNPLEKCSRQSGSGGKKRKIKK